MLRSSLTLCPALTALILIVPGCGEISDAQMTGDSGSGLPSEGAAEESEAGEASEDEDEDEGSAGDEKLDVLMAEAGDDDPCAESGDCGDCEVPEHIPCDFDGADLVTALGLNCPDEPVVVAELNGSPMGMGTMSTFGPTTAFNPTEGQRYAVLGSGFFAELPTVDMCTSGDLGLEFDPGTELPAPLRTIDVGPVTCADDDSLVGTGDCSNTIEEQFEQAANGANDYTEIRFTTEVPEGVTSFSYDFAFMSNEYPNYYGSQFNDMYIGWLESEQWTGNISFDENGNPISLNAGFMDFLDADVDFPQGDPHPDCPAGAGCTSPELAGTCMQGHGATRWLTTEATVTPGETITVAFAIFDMSDSILDSYVFLDNFLWGCEGGSPPSTVPID